MGVRAPDYPVFFRSLFTLTNIRGALVTMPHKVTAAALVDELTPTARAAGAANAVVRRDDDTLVGDQFDGAGFVRGVERKGFALAGKRGSAPTMVLSRAAFGVRGNALPAGLSYVLLVGWDRVALGVADGRGVEEEVVDLRARVAGREDDALADGVHPADREGGEEHVVVVGRVQRVHLDRG